MTNTIPNAPHVLEPCPFCGDTPELPSGDGTQYEIECSGCGQAMAGVQICDLMTLEERAADTFTDYRYGEEFVERAKVEAIERWNTRAPSPAGVDGLEVFQFDWATCNSISNGWPEDVFPLIEELPDEPLCRLSDAQAIIDGLRGEVERLQMQLAACGVVALANTIESAGEARQMRPDYMSASCSDVADAVDREIALRAERDDLLQQLAVRDEEIERIRVQLMTIASAEPARHSIEWAKAVAATGNNEVYAKWREAFDERDQQAQRIGELEQILRDLVPGCKWRIMRPRIDAALAELSK